MMYTIIAQDKTYSSLTDNEFVTIRSVLDYNSVAYQWYYTNV